MLSKDIISSMCVCFTHYLTHDGHLQEAKTIRLELGRPERHVGTLVLFWQEKQQRQFRFCPSRPLRSQASVAVSPLRSPIGVTRMVGIWSWLPAGGLPHRGSRSGSTSNLLNLSDGHRGQHQKGEEQLVRRRGSGRGLLARAVPFHLPDKGGIAARWRSMGGDMFPAQHTGAPANPSPGRKSPAPRDPNPSSRLPL